MAQSIGKGTFFLVIAQLVFVLSNYIIHIFVARSLGPEVYGLFGVLMSLYFINRAFLGTGVPKTLSKFIAENKEKIPQVFRTAFKLQISVAIVFALFYIILAGFLAQWLNDPSLTNYIRFLGLMVIPLSIIPIYSNGLFNGLREFSKQSFIKISYPLLRVVLTLLFISIGFKLWGLLFAYFISLTLGVFFCLGLVKIRKSATGNYNKLISFAVPITIAALAFTLTRNINVLLIKSILGDNFLAGIYTSAATLSNIPFLVLSALPMALLPSISNSVSFGSQEILKRKISQSLRFLLILLIPIAILLMATSQQIITLFYSIKFISAYPVFNILIWASVFITLFVTLNSIITGSGKPKVEMYLILLILFILSVLSLILIPSFGILGAAYSFLIASSIALILAAIYVYSLWKTLIPLISFFRITLASLVLFFFSTYFSSLLSFNTPPILSLLIFYLLLLLLYFSLLLIFGEIKKEDLLVIRNIFKQQSEIKSKK